MLEKIEKVEKEEVPQPERIEKLSQEVFGKPSKDIKYLYVTNYIHQQLLEEELARTGLYQWINVFNGEVKYPRDVLDYSEYDIVHVNMSAQDIHLIGDIREELGKDSKTKLVVNNDYTTEMWQRSFNNPNVIGRELKAPDMIFGTEYHMATALSEMSGRKCFVIPHPADVKRLKAINPIPKKDVISVIWRRYDNHAYIPSFVARNHGLTTQLIGYDKKVDPKVWLTTSMYDYVFAGTNCFDFCDQMRESRVVYDPFTYHSYNRAIVECAALGVPVVGSNRTQSINVCYPYTKVDPYDVKEARKLIGKLLNDDEFREKVIKYALESAEFYNHANAKEKYLLALKEAKEEIKPKEKKKKTSIQHSKGDDVNILLALDKNQNETKQQKFKKNSGKNPV